MIKLSVFSTLLLVTLTAAQSAPGTSYQKSVRPDPTGTPTNVTVNVYVREARLNEKTQELETILTLRMKWKDSRLENVSTTQPGFFDPKTPTSDLANEIWIPDIFFGSERTASFHNVLTKNSMLRITPGGDVFYSIRITVNFLCKLDYTKYPFDQQTCNITIESYGLPTSELNLLWQNSKPVTTKEMELGNYRFTEVKTSNSTGQASTGNYSQLIIQLKAEHLRGPTFYRFFLPVAVITMISWVAFYLHPEDVIIRVLLGLLALGAPYVLNSAAVDIAPGSALTGFDTWTLVSVFFGAMAVLESVVANRLVRSTLVKSTEDKPMGFHSIEVGVCGNWALRLDFLSRIGFPILYAIFNVIFWSAYLN